MAEAADEPTPENRILENALAPKRAAGDEGSMEQHPIADQIAALKLQRQAAARRTGRVPFRTFQMVPRGMGE